MKSPKTTIPRWPIALAAGVLLAALATLFWLRGQLIKSEKSVVQGAVQRFEVTGILGRPESSSIIFGDLENLAKASEGNLIQRIYVTKRRIDNSEVTVVPYYVDLLNPEWRHEKWSARLPVGEGPQGFLYIQVDNATLQAVNVAIGLLAVLLAGGFGVLLIRQRGKEQELSATLVELESRKAQVIHLERLALAGQLSANIFHDIKKPVLNIKNEVGDSLDGNGPPAEEIYRSVYAQTELFLQMLRDLGMETFVNASSQVPEWCDIADAVDRSLRLVKYEQGSISVTVAFAQGRAFFIQSQPHKLIQIFSNLILNAFQAMGNSGKLAISGEFRGDGSIMQIIVEDAGPGIPAARREEIFSPFITTKGSSGGSGLGLFICRTIINDLGGSIHVEESPPLGGSRFVIKLPASDERNSRNQV